MWKTKLFTTRKSLQDWCDTVGLEVEWVEIAVNNGFGVQYRKFRIIY